jgi:hypothetical protein
VDGLQGLGDEIGVGLVAALASLHDQGSVAELVGQTGPRDDLLHCEGETLDRFVTGADAAIHAVLGTDVPQFDQTAHPDHRTHLPQLHLVGGFAQEPGFVLIGSRQEPFQVGRGGQAPGRPHPFQGGGEVRADHQPCRPRARAKGSRARSRMPKHWAMARP